MTKSKAKGHLDLYPLAMRPITPSPNALNAYQLKGFNPSKKNNECLKPKKGI